MAILLSSPYLRAFQHGCRHVEYAAAYLKNVVVVALQQINLRFKLKWSHFELHFVSCNIFLNKKKYSRHVMNCCRFTIVIRLHLMNMYTARQAHANVCDLHRIRGITLIVMISVRRLFPKKWEHVSNI